MKLTNKKIAGFFREACKYVEENSPDELEWARGISRDRFCYMKAKEFLTEYVWVVYASGFRVAVVEEKFPALKKAFKDFDIKKLSRIRSLAPILRVFYNDRKAKCIVKGANSILEEGFSNFKKRIAKEGPDALGELPGIGPITENHLARNIGLADVAKNDVWIQRLVKLFGAKDYMTMIDYLSGKFKENPGVVDLILWRFCADKGWTSIGYSTLNRFAEEL